MYSQEFLDRRRRVSLSMGEVLHLVSLIPVQTVFSKDLRERLEKIVEEENDASICAIKDAYRGAVSVKDGKLEMDEDAEVSIGDDPGAYVMTWTWVSEEEAGFGPREVICERCGDETNTADSPDDRHCPDCYDAEQDTSDGSSGQDRESYSDTQDRDNYAVAEVACSECGMTYDPESLGVDGVCDGCADKT